jgi:hypothetical protein
MRHAKAAALKRAVILLPGARVGGRRLGRVDWSLNVSTFLADPFNDDPASVTAFA